MSKKIKITHKSSIKSKLLASFFLTFLFLSFQSANALDVENEYLEQYLIDSIIQNFDIKKGVFVSSKERDNSNPELDFWQLTIEALDSLERLNAVGSLNRDSISAIERYVLSCRSFEQITNDTYQREDWWGSIKDSVQALRMLQLIDRLNSQQVASVYNKTLNVFISKGLHFRVGEEGWDNVKWAIEKAMEWGLFDVTEGLALPKIEQKDLSMELNPLKSLDEEIEIFSSNDVSVKWVEANQTRLQAGKNSTEFSFTIQSFDDLLGGGGALRSFPSFKLVLGRSDYEIPLTNFESEEYGRERGLLNREMVNETVSVSMSGGKTKAMEVIREKEIWDFYSLEYITEINIIDSDNKIVYSDFFNPLLLGNTENRTVIINNLYPNRYKVLVETFQTIHEKLILDNPQSNSPEFIGYIDDLKKLLSDCPDNLSLDYTKSSELILKEYLEIYDPESYAILYEDYSEWVEKETPVNFNCQINLQTPTIGGIPISSPYNGTNFIIMPNSDINYHLWTFNPYEASNWDELEQNGLIKYSFVDDGIGSTMVSCNDRSSYVLLFPTKEPYTTYNQPLPAIANLQSRSSLPFAQSKSSLINYQDVLNTSFSELSLTNINDHTMLLKSIAPAIENEVLIDSKKLIDKLFLFYNSTTDLFYNDYEQTLDMWKLLDTLGLSSSLFTKDIYDKVLMSYFNQTYSEKLDKKDNLKEITILSDSENVGKKIHDTYIFVKLLTYNESWTNEEGIDPRKKLSWNKQYEGDLIPRIQNSGTFSQQLETTQMDIYQDIYTEHGTDLQELINDDPNEIRLQKSQYLSNDLMYWLQKSSITTDYDFIFQLFTIFMIGVFLVVFLFDGLPFRKTLIALLCSLIVMVQGLSSPILFSGYDEKLSEYLKSIDALFNMLEEGIYEMGRKIGPIMNTIFEKPLELPMSVIGTTSSLIQTPNQNFGNTTEEAYREYVNNFLVQKNRWTKLFGINGGSLIKYTGDLTPKTYNEYIAILSESSISQYAAEKTLEKEKAIQIAQDRENQRRFSLGWLDDIGGSLGFASKKVESAIQGGVDNMFRKGDSLFDSVGATRNAIRNDLAIKSGLSNSDEILNNMQGILGESGRFIVNTSGSNIIPQIYESIDGAKTLRYTDIYNSDFKRVFNYINSFDDFINSQITTLDLTLLQNIMAITRNSMGGGDYKLIKYLNTMSGSKKTLDNYIDATSGKTVGVVLENENNLSIVKKNLGSSPDGSTGRPVVLDDLIYGSEYSNLEIAKTLDLWGGNSVVKSIEQVEFTKSGAIFTKIASTDEVATYISAMRSRKFMDGTRLKSVDEILEFTSDYKTAFADEWNQFVKNGGKVSEDMKRWANAIDPNFGKRFVDQDQWLLYNYQDIYEAISHLNLGNTRNPVYKSWESLMNNLTKVRLTGSDGIRFDLPLYFSSNWNKTNKGAQKNALLAGLFDNVDGMTRKSGGSQEGSDLRYLQELLFDTENVSKFRRPIYTLKFNEDLIEQAIIQKAFNSVNSTTDTSIKADRINTLEKNGIDLSLRDVLFDSNFNIVKNADEIKFKVVVLDGGQSRILKEIGLKSKGPTDTFKIISKNIADARHNQASASFTLQDVINGGYNDVVGTLEDLFKTEANSNSFTSAAAYALQNKNIQKLMGTENRTWAKKSSIIGYSHRDGVISTNPDVKMMTESGDGGLIAQVKYLRDGMDVGPVLRDFSKTMGFGDSAINMWVLKEGSRVAGQIIEEGTNVIVIGKWLDEPAGMRRVGETIEGIGLLREGQKTVGAFDEWAVGIPRDIMKIQKLSTVKVLQNKLNGSLLARKGWSIDNYDVSGDFKQWLKWGAESFSKQKLTSSTIQISDAKYYQYMLKQIANKYFSHSPYTINPELAVMWDLEEFDTSFKADMTSLMMLNNDFLYAYPSSSGYMMGGVGDASITAMVKSGATESVRIQIPTTLEVFNDATFEEWDAEGLIINGRLELANGSFETVPYGQKGQGVIYIENEDASAGTGGSWSSDTKDYAVRIGRPGIEYLFGTPRINIYDYPVIDWLWKNVPSDNWDVNSQITADWSAYNWIQGQLSIKITDGVTDKWIVMASVTDDELTWQDAMGPYTSDCLIALNPIVWINQYDNNNDGDLNDSGDLNEFENPYVPESVNLLEIARELGFGGTEIWIDEIAFGASKGDASHTLLMADMSFSSVCEDLSGYSQAAIKTIYDVQYEEMGTDWANYLEQDTIKSTYDQMALDLACGVLSGDNGNAQDWLVQARENDTNHEFRHFYTDGLVIVKNSSEPSSPIRGLYFKQKHWAPSGDKLNAPVWNMTDFNEIVTAYIYYDEIYTNGWNRDVWFDAVIKLRDVLQMETGLDVKIGSAADLALFMSIDQPNGMVIILGAIPDTLWSFSDPKNINSVTTNVSEKSILEYYMRNGGTILTSGQFGGGWDIAYLNELTGEVKIGNYDTNNNPVNGWDSWGQSGNDLNTDIADLINYPVTTGKPSAPVWMDNSYSETEELNTNYLVKNYYSNGLPWPSTAYDSKIQQVLGSGNSSGYYTDIVWTVAQDSSPTIEDYSNTGTFITYHTGNDNSSPGSIKFSNMNSFILDLTNIISGVEIKYPVVTAYNDTWITEDTKDVGGNSSYYLFDTFENGTDGWSNLTTGDVYGQKVGTLSNNNTTKSIDGASVLDYPYISADLFVKRAATPQTVDTGEYSYALNDWNANLWTNYLPTASVESNSSNNVNHIEGNNCHQFYYTSAKEKPTSYFGWDPKWEHDKIPIDLYNPVSVGIDTYLQFAVNPYHFEGIRDEPNAVSLRDDYANEWFMRLQINNPIADGIAYLFYYFTVETPIIKNGVPQIPENGIRHDHHMIRYIDPANPPESGWWYNRNNPFYVDGNNGADIPQFWIPIDVNSNYNLWDLDQSTGTIDGTHFGDWSYINRNILEDYNRAFGQQAENIAINSIDVSATLTQASEAWILLDDFSIYDLSDDSNNEYYLQTQVTDGEYDVNIYLTTSDSRKMEIDIPNEGIHSIGDIWIGTDGNYSLLGGSASFPVHQSRIHDSTSTKSWLTVGGSIRSEILSLAPYLPQLNLVGLTYKGDLNIYSSDPSGTTKIDNVVLMGNKNILYDTESVENKMGLSLHVQDSSDSNIANGITRDVGEQFVHDYNDFSFSVYSEYVSDRQLRVRITSGGSDYYAHLTDTVSSRKNLEEEFITNDWCQVNVNLMDLRKDDGTKLTMTSTFTDIYIQCGTNDIWFDNITLRGNRGVLFSDTFDNANFYTGYNNYFYSGGDGSWVSQHGTSLSIENCYELSNSLTTIDVNRQDYIATTCEGTGTFTLKMYAFYEDGTLYQSTPITITSGLLDGWGKKTILKKLLIDLGLDPEIRFLAIPTLTSDESVVVDEIEANSSFNESEETAYETDQTSVGIIGTGTEYYEKFDYHNEELTKVTEGSSDSFTDDFEDGVLDSNWTTGFRTGDNGGIWSLSETGRKVKVQCTTKGSAGEEYGMYLDVDLAGDFDIKVNLERHDLSGSAQNAMLYLIDDSGNIISQNFIYDVWTGSTAYKYYARIYDTDGTYNASYDWNNGSYIWNYDCTIGYRIYRENGTMYVQTDATGTNPLDFQDSFTTRVTRDDSRTVDKIWLVKSVRTDRFNASAYVNFDEFIYGSGGGGGGYEDPVSDGIVYLSSGMTMTPQYNTDSENLVMSFQTKLEDINDTFSFDFSDYQLSYSSTGSSYLYRDSTEIASSNSHPIDNLIFSNIKMKRNHERISIWIDGCLFLSGVDSQALPSSPHTFSWKSLGTGVYIDNVSIVGQDKENSFSSSSAKLILPLNEGEGDSVQDISGTGNNGIITNASWIDSELYFDGSGDYVVIADDDCLDITDELTVSLWVKPTALSGSESVLEKGWNNYRIILNESVSHGVKIVQRVGATDEIMTSAADVINNDSWHHIAYTYDGDNLRLFVDGRLEDTEAASGDLYTNSSDMKIGTYNTTQYFDGVIRNVTIHKNALDQHEINQLFINGSESVIHAAPIINSPIASWDLTTKITNPADNSDYWVYDTAGNGIQYNTDDVINATFEDSEGSYYFDGDLDYIVVDFGADYDVGTKELSLSTWVKSNNPTANNMFASFGNATDNKRAYFGTYGAKWDMGIRDSGYGTGGAIDTVENEWTNITVVFNSTLNTVNMYVNGAFSFTKTYTDFSLNDDLRIGTYGDVDQYEWDGYIAAVQIYDYALSPQEILTLSGKGSILKENASVIRNDFSTELSDWTINANIEIPTGTSGNILEFVVDGKKYAIESENVTIDKVKLKTDELVGSSIHNEGFEDGINDWSVVDNPGNMTFTQSTLNTRAGTYSAVHLKGSSTSSQYRIDRWDTPGTHTEGTFEGWVKCYTGSNYEVMAFLPLLVDKNNFYGGYFYNNKLRVFSTKDGVWTWYPDSNGFALGESTANKWWWFKATVEDGSPSDFLTIEYKRDGWANTQTTGKITLDSNNNLGAGYAAIRARGGYSFWDYHWDELQFSSASSPIQEVDLYNGYYTGDSSLKLSVDLTEREGELVKDESVYSHPCTLIGNPYQGKLNGMEFDGADDYISIGTQDELSFTYQDDFTLSAWVYPHTTGGFNHIMGIGYPNYRLAINNDKLSFRLDSNNVLLTSVNSIPTYEWTLVTAVYSATDNKAIIYINGELDNSTVDETLDWTSAGNFAIGNTVNESYYFDGYIRNVNVWGSVLSKDEIISLGRSINSSAGGLIGDYKSITVSTTQDGNMVITIDGEETIINGASGSLESVKLVNSSDKDVSADIWVERHTSQYISNQSLKYKEISPIIEGSSNNIIQKGNTISGELHQFDALGLKLPLSEAFNEGSAGYYSIMVKPFVENIESNCTINFELDSSSVTTNVYSVKNYVDNPINGKDIANNTWTEVIFSTLDYTTDQDVNIWLNSVSSDPGKVLLEIGEIKTVSKSNLCSDLKEFLPINTSSKIGNKDQFVYHDNGTFILEERNMFPAEYDNSAYISIPVDMKVQNDLTLSFDWKIDQEYDTDVGAGVMLKILDSTPGIFYHYYSHSSSIYQYSPRAGITSNPSEIYSLFYNYFIGQGSGSHGSYAYVYYNNGSDYTVYRGYPKFINDIWISLNGVNTLPTGFSSQVGSDIRKSHLVDSNHLQDQWNAFSMNIDQLVENYGDTLESIYLVIDQHGKDDSFRLSISNLNLSNRSTSVMDSVNRKIGSVRKQSFYLKEWIASPKYALYSPKQPKTNLVPDPSFEDEQWLYTADGFEWGYFTPAQTYYDVSDAHVGTQSMKFFAGEELLIPFALNENISSSSFILDFWVKCGDNFDLKAGIMHSASSYVNGYPTNGIYTNNRYFWSDIDCVDDWAHIQMTIDLSYSGNDAFVWFQNNGSTNINIDAIQLKPYLNKNTSYSPESSQMIRTFDPENINSLSFSDGWYELSLDGSDPSQNYVSVYDETATFSASWYPASHTQYFYTEILADLDGATLAEDSWKITIDDPNSSVSQYYSMCMLWVNGVLQGSNVGGTFSSDTISIKNGINTLLFSITVDSSRPTTNENSFSFNLDQSDGTWEATDSIATLMPRSKIYRTPLVYYDQNQETLFVSRENDNTSNIVVDLDLEYANYNNNSSKSTDYSFNENYGNINEATYDQSSGELFFDGSSDYVDVDNDIGNPTQATMAIWIKPTDSNTRTEYIMDGRTGGNWWWLKSYYQGTQEGNDSGNINFHDKVVADVDTYSLNRWNHVAVTIDESGTNTVIKLFVNGELEDSWSGSFDFDFGIPRIGARYTGTSKWKGYFKGVQMWERTLSEDEINEILLKGSLDEFLIDNPLLLANNLMGSFAANGIPAVIGGTNRLINYIDSDIEMTQNSLLNKTTWHPFGSVIMTHDTFPKAVFDGTDDSPIEEFIEAGGKLTTAPGSVPFTTYSEYGDGFSNVAGSGSYAYSGAFGHQLVFDIDEDNMENGAPGDRDDFASGLFITDASDNDYGATIDLPDASGNYSSNMGPPGGNQVNNLTKYNYEPYFVSTPAFTQLPHTGYTFHMVLTKAEYDTVRDKEGGTYYHSVYNGDGSSGIYSSRDSHSSLGGNYYGTNTLDNFTSPLDAGLWFKPFLYDEYGVSQISNPNAYYQLTGSTDDAQFNKHERVVPGVGSIQGGKNAKGIVNISPMFHWGVDQLNGLDNDSSKPYHRGKFADRGYGSITNSPTTELLARQHLGTSLAEMMVSMALDSIITNVCRDNNTTGTNFLNFGSETHLAKDVQLTSEISADVNGSPITFGWSPTTINLPNYLHLMGEYPIFGGEHGRGTANADAVNWDSVAGNMTEKQNTWSRMTYGLPEGATVNYVDLLGKRDGLITLTNIDKDVDTVPYGSATVGEDTPTAFIIEGMMYDGESGYSSELSTAITPFKQYNGQGMIYSTSVTDPSPSFHYILGLGDDPGSDYITNFYVNTTGTKNSNSWQIYNEDHSGYNDYYLGGYYEGDTELILRNSEIGNYSLTNDTHNWQNPGEARYFQPVIPIHQPDVTGSSHREMDILYSSNSSFTASSTFGNDISYLFDDNVSTTGYLGSSFFDDDTGYTYDVEGNVLVSIDFTDGTHDLTGMVLYQDSTQALREVEINLFDLNGNIIFANIYSLPESARVGGDDPNPSNRNSLRPGQPKYIPFDGTIDDVQSVEIRAHRKYVTFNSSTWAYSETGGLSEIELFGDNLPQPTIYYPEILEAFDRKNDDGLGDSYLDSNQIYTDEMYDNGDDYFDIDNEEFGYYSDPRQNGMTKVDIYSRRSQPEIKSMRWQTGYSSIIRTTSEFSSMNDYLIASAPELSDPWDDPLVQFLLALLMLISIIVVAVLFTWGAGVALTAVFGSTLGTTLAILGGIYSGIVVMGAAFELRYMFGAENVNFRYEQGSIFENNVLARLAYDWIYDIDGTVGRLVVTGFTQGKLPYDFMYLEWYGEEYRDQWGG